MTEANGPASRDLVFLIGYRGTGKTTVARLLAERLAWDWLDADALLEATHGRTIREIFAAEGESGFRDKESALLSDLCRRQRHVIATGGGIILRPTHREQLRSAGWVVWLTAGTSTLWERIQKDTTTGERRPNLTGGGLVEVEELLQMRAPLYRETAHLVVSTEGRSPEDVAADIHRQLMDR
jgi:shikimate kinase